jgi:hypothetical protein
MALLGRSFDLDCPGISGHCYFDGLSSNHCFLRFSAHCLTALYFVIISLAVAFFFGAEISDFLLIGGFVADSQSALQGRFVNSRVAVRYEIAPLSLILPVLETE